MPWPTFTRDDLRALNRDNIQASLRSTPLIPNSGLRVMSDADAGMAFLTLLYIKWLSDQLLPDTAETEWLDRHAAIWLTQGRKAATYASGTANAVGIANTDLPAGTTFNVTGPDGTSVTLQTTEEIVIGATPTQFSWNANTPGATGLVVGSTIALSVGIAGVNGVATVTTVTDGVDGETDDQLRVRVLDRIQEPPMGGDAEDYVQWALEYPGVTRAWTAPNEMGIGTITVRFMMDDLRASNDPTTNGFPLSGDVTALAAYLDTRRPVSIKDFFVVAPTPEPINFTVTQLFNDTTAVRAAIADNVDAMLREKALPSHARNGVLQSAQTIYSAWVSEAISDTQDVEYFDLTMSDHVMPNNGAMGVLGTITWPS